MSAIEGGPERRDPEVDVVEGLGSLSYSTPEEVCLDRDPSFVGVGVCRFVGLNGSDCGALAQKKGANGSFMRDGSCKLACDEAAANYTGTTLNVSFPHRLF